MTALRSTAAMLASLVIVSVGAAGPASAFGRDHGKRVHAPRMVHTVVHRPVVHHTLVPVKKTMTVERLAIEHRPVEVKRAVFVPKEVMVERLAFERKPVTVMRRTWERKTETVMRDVHVRVAAAPAKDCKCGHGRVHGLFHRAHYTTKIEKRPMQVTRLVAVEKPVTYERLTLVRKPVKVTRHEIQWKTETVMRPMLVRKPMTVERTVYERKAVMAERPARVHHTRVAHAAPAKAAKPAPKK